MTHNDSHSCDRMWDRTPPQSPYMQLVILKYQSEQMGDNWFHRINATLALNTFLYLPMEVKFQVKQFSSLYPRTFII